MKDRLRLSDQQREVIRAAIPAGRQRTIAKDIGWTATSFNKWLQGSPNVQSIRIDRLRTLLDLLGLDREEFLSQFEMTDILEETLIERAANEFRRHLRRLSQQLGSDDGVSQAVAVMGVYVQKAPGDQQIYKRKFALNERTRRSLARGA